MKFVDGLPIQKANETRDGYMVGRVRCARTGIQVYTRDELKLTEGPEVVRVYRPPEAVFDKSSIATYAGKPVTLGHPKDGVNADNWKSLAIGTTGANVLRDGDAVVIDFSIMDAAAIEKVKAGTVEISMGYSTPMVLESGVTPSGEAYDAIQTGPILINHLAIVDTARGGADLRIVMDAAPWGATPINTQAENQNMTTKTVVLGDSAVTLSIADAAAVEAFKANMAAQLKQVTDAAKKDADEKDEMIGKLKAQNKKLEDAAVTPAKLTKLIADRVALETTARALHPTVVTDGVADDDLRKAVVAARLGDALVADATPAEVNGAFKALAAVPIADDTMRNALSSIPVADGKVGAWTDSIAAKAGVSLKKKG